MPSAWHNFRPCIFSCRPCTHTCITKSSVYISLCKCCFFYLISYYRANVISINYKICWRQEKLLRSLAPCMTLAHSTTSGDELPGANILPRGFLGIHESFYALEGSFHFPCLSLESTQLGSIEWNSTICYWSSTKFKALGLEFRAKWTTEVISASTDFRVLLKNKHKLLVNSFESLWDKFPKRFSKRTVSNLSPTRIMRKLFQHILLETLHINFFPDLHEIVYYFNFNFCYYWEHIFQVFINNYHMNWLIIYPPNLLQVTVKFLGLM